MPRPQYYGESGKRSLISKVRLVLHTIASRKRSFLQTIFTQEENENNVFSFYRRRKSLETELLFSIWRTDEDKYESSLSELTILHDITELFVSDTPIRLTINIHHLLYFFTGQIGLGSTTKAKATDKLQRQNNNNKKR